MIRLECTRGGSNKFYEFHLTEVKGRVTVTGYYGRIGQAPNEHPVYDGDNKDAAVAAMQKKQLEKEKKGYVIIGSNGAKSAPVQKKKTMSCR